MNFWTIYEPTTGKIIAFHSGGDPEPPPTPEGTLVVPLPSSPSTDYIVGGVAVPRPKMNVTIRGEVITGIPRGATISIEEQDYVADGTDIELEISVPGTYLITVSLWPYLDEIINYEAQA